jgi:hypothetical protein
MSKPQNKHRHFAPIVSNEPSVSSEPSAAPSTPPSVSNEPSVSSELSAAPSIILDE